MFSIAEPGTDAIVLRVLDLQGRSHDGFAMERNHDRLRVRLSASPGVYVLHWSDGERVGALRFVHH